MTKEIKIFYADGRGYSIEYCSTYDHGQGDKGGYTKSLGFLQNDIKAKYIEEIFDMIQHFLLI